MWCARVPPERVLVRDLVSRLLLRWLARIALARDLALTGHVPSTPRARAQVTEEEYAELVNKRRKEYGGFIVGEDGDECVPPPAVARVAFKNSMHPLLFRARFVAATAAFSRRRRTDQNASDARVAPLPPTPHTPQLRRPRRRGRLD